MKIAYFDCFSGISGDMINAALINAGLEVKQLRTELDKLNLGGYRVLTEQVMKNSLSATRFAVIEEETQVFRHLNDLTEIIDKSHLKEDIKTGAKSIFRKIASAEAKIHNQPIKKVHFHEIGAVDTIIDVVGALAGLKILGIDRVFCSPINVGSGFVNFSHGRYPVPAPAAAELLKNVPIYSTDSGGELTTPTGAAIITEIAHGFGDMPEMKSECIGYGAGTKDFKQPNVLRVFIGKVLRAADLAMDMISVIETNIDDMNPQIYDHLFDVFFSNGALDVFLSNIAMKKNRPAVKLTVLCDTADEKKFSGLIFRETSSIGVRIRQEKRYKLPREIQKIQTEYGEIKIKISKLRGEILSRVPEYDDCKRIAREKGIPLKMIYDAVLQSISGKP